MAQDAGMVLCVVPTLSGCFYGNSPLHVLVEVNPSLAARASTR